MGPFLVRDLLAHSIDDSIPLPPESGSAYLVSQKGWSERPTDKCAPLYVGRNTGQSARFRTRRGDLLADPFGFFNISLRPEVRSAVIAWHPHHGVLWPC